MKNVKWFFPVIVACFGIFSLSSCAEYYEDDFDTQEQFDDEVDNDNSGNNGGGGSADGAQLDDEGGVAIYRVDGQNIIKMDSRNVSPSWMNDDIKHQDIWDMVTTLIPADKRRWLTTFEVFDGGQELLGYVYNSTPDLTSWNFALGIDSAYPDGENLQTSGDFIHTIIHEYGHIMSLNDEQLNASANSCNAYNPGEGCSYESSYIGNFYQRFWADIASEHSNISPDDYDALDSFYDKYEDRFVSNYAATNPAEDIAEVFAHFIVTENEPTGNQIKDEKVRFMYQYPELVDLRSHMKNSTFTMPAPNSWRRPNCGHKKHNHRHATL